MGCFAYKTSDTNKTFVNADFGAKIGVPVVLNATLLLPCGEKFTGRYDGYGRIENLNGELLDIFSAVMASNLQEALDDINAENLRNDFFDNFDGNSLLIKIVEDSRYNFDEVEASDSCESQGCFYIGEEENDEDNYY